MEKNSYERRVYDSIDVTSLSKDMSRKLMEIIQVIKGLILDADYLLCVAWIFYFPEQFFDP